MRKLLIFLSLTIINLIGCSQNENSEVQGYIEGRYIYVATSVSGILNKLLVARGAFVKKGDLLFLLEQEPESDIYSSSEENLKQSIAARDAIAANLAYAKITYERYKVLVPQRAVDQAQLDNAKSVFNATTAQLAQANATIASSAADLSKSKWTLNQKEIFAPTDSIVFDTYYRIGEYTVANQAILSLLAPADIKAIFYVPEETLSFCKLGNKVTIRCDRCKKAYTAKISFISPTAEYTPPVIYSEQTNSKLIYRIEAEFLKQEAFDMHPGQPIYVNYLTQ